MGLEVRDEAGVPGVRDVPDAPCAHHVRPADRADRPRASSFLLGSGTEPSDGPSTFNSDEKVGSRTRGPHEGVSEIRTKHRSYSWWQQREN